MEIQDNRPRTATRVHREMLSTMDPSRVFREWWTCSLCLATVGKHDPHCRGCGAKLKEEVW